MAGRLFLEHGRLSPFGAVLAPRVAGWHDGVKATIDFDFVNNLVVFHHEEAHETLFRKTPDGTLLAVLYMLLDSGRPLDADLRKRIEITSRTLFTGSLVAHEIAATYIGIKTPARAVGEQALPLLPPDYRRYYHAAADVIDPHFRSTQLQVSVLSTLAHHAFASTFMRDYLARDWPACDQLSRSDCPNSRLETLLSLLADGAVISLRAVVERAAEDAFATLGTTPWDIDSDEAWESTPPAVAYGAELAIQRRIEEWIIEQGAIPYLEHEERGRALAQLGTKAAQLGLSLRIESSAREPPAGETTPASAGEFDAFLTTDTRSAAHRQAGSQVSNSARLDFPRWDSDALWKCAEVFGGPQLILVHPDPFIHGTEWTVLISGPQLTRSNCRIAERRCWGVRVDEKDVMPWLGALARADADFPQTLSPSLIVLPYPGAEGRIYRKFAGRSIHYLVRNWAKLIDSGLSVGPIAVTELEVGVLASGDPASTEVQSSFILHIAYAESLLGCTFRALGRQASTAMAPLEVEWRKSPNYQWLTSEEARAAGLDLDAVYAAFSAISAVWSAF